MLELKETLEIISCDSLILQLRKLSFGGFEWLTQDHIASAIAENHILCTFQVSYAFLLIVSKNH